MNKTLRSFGLMLSVALIAALSACGAGGSSSAKKADARPTGAELGAHIVKVIAPAEMGVSDETYKCLGEVMAKSKLSDKALSAIMKTKDVEELNAVDTKLPKADQEILSSEEFMKQVNETCAPDAPADAPTTAPDKDAKKGKKN